MKSVVAAPRWRKVSVTSTCVNMVTKATMTLHQPCTKTPIKHARIKAGAPTHW
jgi:hypothetical protein